MSSSGSNSHSKRLPSETEHAQRVLEMDAAQQMKIRERQRFFEEVFQHDVDVFLSTTHLQIEHKRPPIGSISSMEVNVDMLEQMELMDISDQEALDVFLNSGADESDIPSPRADQGDEDQIMLQVPHGREVKSRMSSTSSTSTDPYSLDTSEEGADTPTVQSDDEEVHASTELLTNTPLTNEDEEGQSVPTS
ncbi:dysbindin-like isoform X1 [Lepisosteus oculatus]|uniref:Si:ch211-253b8.5 n=1 Tax=Lepisosteus oculatus TaxID=7918 RepID=W5M783_LEPOC|nr:PREDICTED: dysbindin-like isoform X1 [Lepisosteus oculatus]